MSDQDQALKSLHMHVEGRVQGVGFRYFVAKKAEELSVNGWVRNRWDGTVEIMAEGQDEHLNMLANAVRKGPRGAFVSDLQLRWGESTGRFSRFKIRQTG